MTITSSLLRKIPGLAHGFGTKREAPPEGVVTSKQVHGVAILEVNEGPTSLVEGYDILITDRPNITVGVKTADCQPILIVEPHRKIAAAVHAGWKGTLQRAVQVAIRRIVEKGGRAENLVCALGPNMAGNCFEVEADVAGDFEREFPGWSILRKTSETKWLLDVALTNRLQLQELGVPEDQIDQIDLCTHCRPDLFWSYRRDGGAAGRMVNFIQLLH